MATTGYSIHAEGARECAYAFEKISDEVDDKTGDALKRAAKPVADDARKRISKYQGASLGTIVVKATRGGATVTQTKGRVTGLRGDFGALQMTQGFMPALDAHASDIERAVNEALVVVAREAGFH